MAIKCNFNRNHSITGASFRSLISALFLILLLSSLVACSKTNQVDSVAMSNIKLLSITGFDYTNNIVLKAAKNENSGKTFGAEVVKQIVSADSRLVMSKLSASSVPPRVIPISNNIQTNVALTNLTSDDTASLARMVAQSQTDGLLWISREYRIRASRNILGDLESEWSGEVRSQMRIVDRTGKQVLSMAWVDQSDKKKKGANLSSQDSIDLLLDATDKAVNSTYLVLVQTTLGRGIPKELRDELTESEQEQVDSIADFGMMLRAVLVLALLFLGGICVVNVSNSLGIGFLGVIFLGSAAYLLIGRGWWSDTLKGIWSLVLILLSG